MSQVLSSKDLVSEFIKADADQRIKIVEKATEGLSNTQLKNFKKEIKKIETDEAESEDDAPVDTPAPSTVDKGKGKAGVDEPLKDREANLAITDAVAQGFWNDLEKMSGDELLSEQVVKDFQYIGFDPSVIMKSIIMSGQAAKKTKVQILNDIASMCTIAIIKGSITDKNLKKMSDAGKRSYELLESTYKLKRNGSKGVDPSVVTIARVGAAFPGSMMKILMKRTDLAKKFAGPFGSKALPAYLRHQSAAACIPDTLDDKIKQFLIGLVIAYTSDQSKTISTTKDKPEELYARQENFISSTHASPFPVEDVRRTIFKSWSLSADYDKLKQVGDNITKHVSNFSVPSREDFVRIVASV